MAASNPWDVLPREPIGDADVDVIYAAVGEASSAWERVEENQQALFGAIVNSRLRSAEVAYGTVASAAARSDMLLAAADRAFEIVDPGLRDEIFDLVNEVGKLSARRNEIVHGHAARFALEKDKPPHCYLVPSYATTRKQLNSKQANEAAAEMHSTIGLDRPEIMFFTYKYAYTSRQIHTYTQHFTAYRLKLTALINKTLQTCAELWPSHERHPGLPIPPLTRPRKTKR